MSKNERFGLPLSLTEALRADPSPDAALLANLLEEGEAPASRPPAGRLGRRWRTALAGVSLAAGFAMQGYAGTTSLEGRWTMAPALSSFEERVTGPAPDRATVVVSRDDARHFSYELSESRGGVSVAHGNYDLSFIDSLSTSSVDGTRLPVAVERDVYGDIVIRAPVVDGLQALIRVRRTGPNTALLEHEVQGATGSRQLERISLVRDETPSY
ncbi:hypothetical protein [Caulobacter sp. S45]|uniref:hypothetical protein n=1 Tax=Caulobacter sp. S45 TaxID=1641861 RepID=UPI0015775383|nr:hypothetical protein [Caulobacter sp. S45]